MGPLIFSICISCLHKCLTHCQIHYYADDMQMWYNFKHEEVAVATWFKFDYYKSTVTIFDRKVVRDTKLAMNIKVDGVSLESSVGGKSLALYLDEELRITRHINNCAEIRISLSKKFVPGATFCALTKMSIYNTLIISKLSYCNVRSGTLDERRVDAVSYPEPLCYIR